MSKKTRSKTKEQKSNYNYVAICAVVALVCDLLLFFALSQRFYLVFFTLWAIPFLNVLNFFLGKQISQTKKLNPAVLIILLVLFLWSVFGWQGGSQSFTGSNINLPRSGAETESPAVKNPAGTELRMPALPDGGVSPAVVDLDGKRVEGNKAIDVAIDCEATDLIYRNGWYYLLGTHGTCCDGANSTYNIVCGRSRKVTGPYVDNVGRDMIHGGGKMVVDAEDRRFGAGHFGREIITDGIEGREIITDGIEKMSFHFEADLDMSGYSTLAIRPIVWKNDWPTVGENIEDGVYEISSERRGYALELSVDFTRAEGGMRWFNRNQERPIEKVKNQAFADVEKTFPSGVNPVRMNEWMNRPHQRWQVVAVPEKGGYLGGPYFKQQPRQRW